jgi:carbohydrate diacid regulator
MTKLSHSAAQQIVERVTASLGLQVSVVDTASTVLASTKTMLVGTQIPPTQPTVGDARPGMDGGDQAGDISFPLVFANTAIGAVVIHDNGPQRMQLAPAAKALADLILHQLALLDQVMHQHWVRDRFIFNLLHGSFNAAQDEVQHEAAMLDIDLDIPRLVAIIDVPTDDEPAIDHRDPDGAAVIQSYPTHLVERARRVIHGHNQDIYGWCAPRWLVVLTVVDPQQIEADRQTLAVAMQRFLDTLAPELPAPPSAGIGRYYPGWVALPHSFADARFALKLGIQIHGAGRAFLPKDLGLASFVCQGDAMLKSAIAHRLLQPLLDKADLFTTLDTFLHANLSPSLAAESLCIHRHTLDYRLNKIAHLTGLDPRDFGAAAQLLAAVLWLDVEGVEVMGMSIDASTAG